MAMTETPLFNLTDPRVQPVFDYWKEIMGKRSNTLLDTKRSARIEWALSHFDEADVLQAIKGCSQSPFHMGKNRNGRKYNDVELILRDASHIERFIEIADEEAEGSESLDRWLNT